ncbi:Methionine aminopeptidase 1 [Sorochytrium milnesiophthora]
MTQSESANACQGVDCPNTTCKLVCPTCVKLGLPKETARFCSQDCFKKNWSTHKTLHGPVAPQLYDPFPNLQYTGTLRPVYPLSPMRSVPAHIPRPDYAETGISLAEREEKRHNRIEVLNEAEIAKMRTVCRLAREVLDLGAAAIRPGVTTDEIDRIVHEASVARNCYPSPLNYVNFPKSCCTSVNEVICHGIPDQRPLQDGDIVNLDVSVYHDGFHADLNETYFVGRKSWSTAGENGEQVATVSQRLVDATRECLKQAIAAVKPGVLYRDMGNIIEKVAKKNGFSVVRTYCGHGINRLFHPAPSIPHYARNKAVGVMKPGHVFTIEPMINEGTYRDEHWPDNWTAVTADGKRSAQFEHTMVVTETGCEVLTLGQGWDTVMDGLREPDWEKQGC